MNEAQIVSALLMAARSAVDVSLGELAGEAWPALEPGAREVAEELAREMLSATAEPAKEKDSPHVLEAIEIALGEREAPEEGFRIIGAKKDLNAKGNGPEYYRMVYRNGWRYVSTDRLPQGKIYASDRRATVYGDVYAGEIVAAHDRGQALDEAWLVIGENKGASKIPVAGKTGNSWGIQIDIKKLRNGLLRFVLPDGRTIDLPNPRAR
jgi:hypothetical protein